MSITLRPEKFYEKNLGSFLFQFKWRMGRPNNMKLTQKKTWEIFVSFSANSYNAIALLVVAAVTQSEQLN